MRNAKGRPDSNHKRGRLPRKYEDEPTLFERMRGVAILVLICAIMWAIVWWAWR
jgi:hypothetical protein